MLFNSYEFLAFFPIVTLLFFLLPQRFRWMLLLASSCFFYAYFKPIYLWILIFTIVIDYFAGLWIEKTQGVHRKWALAISIVANVGVLAIFKYYNFIAENLNAVLHRAGTGQSVDLLDIILPIGLSFHTFQAMSYTIEVYRGTQPAERNFGIYALYVMFYPQLVAGPIERPQNILHQFYEKHSFVFSRVISGLQLMLWGMFKKVVIADRLSLAVDKIYSDPHAHTGLPLVMGTLFFTFQIFCDFSGYSDIAIGSARVMGFNLMKNFDRPYLSKSISEFWRRWHISLSTWFRDYLYIPLGGNRVPTWRKYFNLFFVFLISGLWHGAAWTYVIWGALHGVYLVFGQLTASWQAKINKLIRNEWVIKILHGSITFFLVYISWVFFRAKSLKDALYILKNMAAPSSTNWSGIVELLGGKEETLILIFAFLLMEGVHWLQRGRRIELIFNPLPRWQRWGIYYLILGLILFYGVYNQTQFIYFQF